MRLETLLTHPAVEALGRSLLHFLWQGSFLVVLLWMVKTIVPAEAARIRYAVASLIMLAMPVAVLITVMQDLHYEGPAAKISRVDSSQAQAPSDADREALLASSPTTGPSAGMSGSLPGRVVCIWTAGVLLLSLRALGGWMQAQRLKRRVLAIGGALEDMMTRLRDRLGITPPVCLYRSAIAQVPTVVGWLRPCILLPVTAITSLSESQLHAILAHELAHIRRHDYLVNLLQTAIETVLFYHPAVWWVGRQMRIEREHCCDDIAVAVCGSAIEYAGALAELEEIRGRIPEPALAATGGDLLGRIRRLLDRGCDDNYSRSMQIVATALLLLLMTGAPVIVSLHAAPEEPEPAFEVASIKRTPAEIDPGPRYGLGRRTHVESATLKDLVRLAYDVEGFQVSGGPGWATSDRYNIEAAAPGKPAPGPEARLTTRRRLQALLRDRFQLELHRDTKELPIYELRVAKGGFKLQPVQEGSCAPFDADKFQAGGSDPMSFCGYGGFGRSGYEASTATMTVLAKALPYAVERIVIDKTGISGVFRIQLKYAPDSPAPRPDAANPAADSGPDIFTALQEQLGLRLESAKGPVDLLVIDHAEKPSEN